MNKKFSRILLEAFDMFKTHESFESFLYIREGLSKPSRKLYALRRFPAVQPEPGAPDAAGMFRLCAERSEFFGEIA